MIILLDQQEYAVGLSWFAISTTQEVEQFQRELDLSFGVLKMSKDGDEQSTVALCGPEYNAQVSLAGMLSFAYLNLIYVTATDYKNEAGEPLYYLCAIKNHAVTVDGDVMGTREAIAALYAQNYADLTADIDASEVTLYGTDVDDEMFPGVNLVEPHQVIDPGTRFTAQATIKPLGKKELSKLSLVAIVILFFGVCFGIYEFFFNEPPPPPPAPVVQAPRPIIPKKDPYQEYLKQFAQTLQQQPRASMILPVTTALKKLPMSYSGWMVNSASFTGAGSETFGITLVREPYATANDLLQAQQLGLLTGVNIDTAGNNASASVLYQNPAPELISIETIQALPRDGRSQYYALLSKMQKNNMPFTANTESQNPYFTQTSLVFTGKAVWSMVALFEMLAPFETLGINSITVKIDKGNYNWTIEGVIYG